MTHTTVKSAVEALGLTVKRTPASFTQAWEGQGNGIRVYWSRSLHSDFLVGALRVRYGGRDTHCRSVKELQWHVEQWRKS